MSEEATLGYGEALPLAGTGWLCDRNNGDIIAIVVVTPWGTVFVQLTSTSEVHRYANRQEFAESDLCKDCPSQVLVMEPPGQKSRIEVGRLAVSGGQR